MNERLNDWLTQIFNLLTLATAVAIPFFFWNLTTEFYETPKFLFLVAVTLLLIVIWFLRFAISGKITITRTPLDIAMILLLVVLVISTFFAASKPAAIMGNIPRIHGGLATFTAYILFYFALSSNLKHINTIKQAVYLLLLSGIVLSILSLFSYFGQNLLPMAWTSHLSFTPTGSNFSTTAILSLLLPFPLIAILRGTQSQFLINSFSFKTLDKIAAKTIAAAIATLFLITITLTGSLATFTASLAVYILAILISPQQTIKKNAPFIITPVLVVLMVVFLSRLPLGGSNNILYTQAQNFPREIQLPIQTSWKISISAFRDAPFWGTGPGSYLFDFTTYKPIEFNNYKFWSVRFDQPFNEYLGFLATLGSLGLIALLLLTAVFIAAAFKAFVSPKGSLGVSLAISGIIFFVLLALHSSTLPLWVIGILILVCFMAVHRENVEQVNVGVTEAGHANNLKFDILPGILLLIVLGLVISVLYFTGKSALADYHHRTALNAVTQGKALDAYNELVNAERLNPYVDLYRTDLAQTNFALANAIASAKGPTESSPAGSLTDADKQNIKTLLSQSIDEGKVAVALSPKNPANWEVLGSIYRQISGVAQNALGFSLDSYGRAIQLDPLNPLLRLTVGSIYYSAKNYDLAIRFFTDSINLKPDYANGYYNLAVALKEKGDLTTAVAVAEKTVSLLDPKSQDYKAAADFLADLKTKVEAESNQKKAENVPPAETVTPTPSSALQSKKLPKVLDLPKPDKITTPSAIKKPQE